MTQQSPSDIVRHASTWVNLVRGCAHCPWRARGGIARSRRRGITSCLLVTRP